MPAQQKTLSVGDAREKAILLKCVLQKLSMMWNKTDQPWTVSI